MTIQPPSEFPHVDYETVDLGLLRPHIVPRGTLLPGRRRYLALFIHRHLNFRLPETQCLAEIVYGKATADDGLPVIVWELPVGNIAGFPFWYVHVPEQGAEDLLRGIAERSMLIKTFIELWGEGASWEEVHEQVANYEPETKAKYAAEDQSFKFTLESWGRTLTLEQKIEIIESFEDCTQFRGKIDLKTPQNNFWAIENDPPTRAFVPMGHVSYYFGRQIAADAMGKARGKLMIYDLKKRRYLGPTSMDPELSFIMCSLSGVTKSSLTLDPFVGTGSVLVAAADVGAHVLGTDIDIRVIRHGKKDKKGQSVNIWTNFGDYNLASPVGILRADQHRHPFRDNLEEYIDAIVADPPYGVRAGARKSKSVPEMVIDDRTSHIASTAPYTLAECLRDLVDNAAKWLTLGGKLSYWLPVAPDFYSEDELPTHPALEMESNCEQVLCSKYSRRLIVMKKVRKYDAEAERLHHEKVGPPKMALDDIRDYVYSEGEFQKNDDDGITNKTDRAGIRSKYGFRNKNI